MSSFGNSLPQGIAEARGLSGLKTGFNIYTDNKNTQMYNTKD